MTTKPHYMGEGVEILAVSKKRGRLFTGRVGQRCGTNISRIKGELDLDSEFMEMH